MAPSGFNSLIQTLHRFREGDFEVSFNVNEPGELNSVMLAFNSLAENLNGEI